MTEPDTRADIAKARSRMTQTFGSGRELKKLHLHVRPGERVIRIASGTYSAGTGVLVLTDRRMLFFVDGVIRQQTEDFPLQHVNSVGWRSSLGTGVIVVSSGSKHAEIRNVPIKDGKDLVDVARDVLEWFRNRQAAGAARETPPSSQSRPPGSVTAQLAQAAELHRSGALTDEEFAQLKARLLSA